MKYKFPRFAVVLAILMFWGFGLGSGQTSYAGFLENIASTHPLPILDKSSAIVGTSVVAIPQEVKNGENSYRIDFKIFRKRHFKTTFFDPEGEYLGDLNLQFALDEKKDLFLEILWIEIASSSEDLRVEALKIVSAFFADSKFKYYLVTVNEFDLDEFHFYNDLGFIEKPEEASSSSQRPRANSGLTQMIATELK